MLSVQNDLLLRIVLQDNWRNQVRRSSLIAPLRGVYGSEMSSVDVARYLDYFLYLLVTRRD